MEELLDGALEIVKIFMYSVTMVVLAITSPLWVIPYLVYKKVKQPKASKERTHVPWS